MQFGKYHLERLIARGGMAEVYLALERGALGGERRVVIKRILPKLAEDPDYVEFFVDEGKLCLSLSHPNVVQAYELGCIDGVYYLSMEYVRGESLIAALRRASTTGRQLSPQFVVHVGRSITAALDHAHNARDVRGQALNVIHRDVSPHNILLGFDGVVKLADFGIARSQGQAHETATGVVKGKFAYLAPEQLPMLVGGGSFDHRIDLFALGIVLHEMVTRRPLFRGKNDADTVARLCKGRIPSPLELRPDCPHALARIIMRALERDRARRYPSAAAMLAELERLAAELGGGGFMGAREEIRAVFGVAGERVAVGASVQVGAPPAKGSGRQPTATATGQDGQDGQRAAAHGAPQLAHGSGKQPAARRVGRQDPTIPVLARRDPRADDITVQRPALELLPDGLHEGLSELEVEPLDGPATAGDGERVVPHRMALPLPPPEEGGSAPRLLANVAAPGAPPPTRPFRFGTQPQLLVPHTPAPAPLGEGEAARMARLAGEWLGGMEGGGGGAPGQRGGAGTAGGRGAGVEARAGVETRGGGGGGRRRGRRSGRGGEASGRAAAAAGAGAGTHAGGGSDAGARGEAR